MVAHNFRWPLPVTFLKVWNQHVVHDASLWKSYEATEACKPCKATEACEPYEANEACEPYKANEACEACEPSRLLQYTSWNSLVQTSHCYHGIRETFRLEDQEDDDDDDDDDGEEE